MPVVTEESPPTQRRGGRYPKQFRKGAAALLIDQHRSVADVAHELGVVEQTLRNWVRQERATLGGWPIATPGWPTCAGGRVATGLFARR